MLTFKTDEELKVVREVVHRMVERALALDGTCKSLGPCCHRPGSALTRFMLRYR